MRPAEAHLTPQELESLLFVAADSNVTTADRDATREAQQHLDGCGACQGMAKRYANADAALRNLGPKDRLQNQLSSQLAEGRGSGNDCPPEETWLRLSAGLIGDAAASLYVAHAAQCDWCGNLFREAMEDLAQDVTAEEQAAMSNLESAGSNWQRELVKKLAAETASGVSIAAAADVSLGARREQAEVKQGTKFGWWSRVAFATAAAVVVTVSVWLLWEKLNPDPNELLARAYTDQRTLELRIPGAKHGPMRVQRGAVPSQLNRPTALLDAESRIAHKLAVQPENPLFLEMRGRAEIMDWEYEAAIETFKHGLDLDPESLAFKTDIASAYYERALKAAKSSDRAIDYSQALEYLSQVLAKEPDNAVALFNRAITLEQMFMYGDAIADWEHYLQIDSKGAWADEARGRLAAVRQKVAEHTQKSAAPLLETEEVASQASINDESTWNPLDLRVEDYLDRATRTWLRQAFTPTSAKKAGEERRALRILAAILRKRHGDDWLNDMLAMPLSVETGRGLNHLSEAIARNSAGEAEEAGAEAKQAVDVFRHIGSQAGVARAMFELVYSLHRASQGSRCLEAASTLSSVLKSHAYAWIETELVLEDSVCSNIVRNVGRGQMLSDVAESLAREHHYGILHLRALSFVASYEWQINGNSAAVWSRDRRGLEAFWDGAFPPSKAYSFYQDMTFPAERAEHEQVVYLLRKEAASIDAGVSDESRHGIAHFLLGQAAQVIGRSTEAEAEFRRAQEALARLPKSPSAKMYTLYCDIQLARVKTKQGALDAALALLSAKEDDLRSFSNSPVKAAYYNALGDVDFKERRNHDAEKAFTSAVGVAEVGLNSFKDENDRDAWQKTVAESYRGMVSVALAEHEDERALEIWERYRGAFSTRHEQSRGGAGTDPSRFSDDPSLVNTTRKLLVNETVLSYAVLPEGIAIWVLDDRGLATSMVAVSPEQLGLAVARFVKECSDPRSNLYTLRQNSSQLYEWLIGPVEGRLDSNRTLIIEPDGVLNFVPVQALVNGHGEYLGSRFAITYSPGLQRYERLRPSTAIHNTASAVIVSPPASAGGPAFIPIPDAAREATAVASHFTNAQVLGEGVDWPQIKSALALADVFHFVGHAFVTPNRMALVISDDPANDSEQTAALRPTAVAKLQLAMLSACSTGQPAEDGLPDLSRLIYNFQRAAVPHVIATRWDVDSAVTRRFTEKFYEDLLAGMPVSLSVRTAASMLMRSEGTEHPYYWAAFSSFGRS